MAEQTQTKVVLDDRMLMLFEGNLQRMFALKVTRSTFRELQNVIMNCASQNKEVANFLFETLMTGQIKQAIPNEHHREMLEGIIKHFTIPARLAKEVSDRGEFINIITSDLVSQEEDFAFINRLRRIDGEEFVFMSDTQNTIHLLHHFLGRMQELSGNPKGQEELKKHDKELRIIGEKFKQLAL